MAWCKRGPAPHQSGCGECWVARSRGPCRRAPLSRALHRLLAAVRHARQTTPKGLSSDARARRCRMRARLRTAHSPHTTGRQATVPARLAARALPDPACAPLALPPVRQTPPAMPQSLPLAVSCAAVCRRQWLWAPVWRRNLSGRACCCRLVVGAADYAQVFVTTVRCAAMAKLLMWEVA